MALRSMDKKKKENEKIFKYTRCAKFFDIRTERNPQKQNKKQDKKRKLRGNKLNSIPNKIFFLQ